MSDRLIQHLIQPPKIDPRDSHDLVVQLRRLMTRYAPHRARHSDEDQVSEAMMHVFSRFGEIVIDRINRTPQLNYLAFLQMLGVSNLRPVPAKVPLTFYLSSENAPIATVPERSPIAAQMLPGEKDPILFETDCPLEVVPLRLTALFSKDGGHDAYSDLTHLVPQLPPSPGAGAGLPSIGLPIFSGDTLMAHRLYVGLNIRSASPCIDRLGCKFTLREDGSAPVGRTPGNQNVQWTLCIPPAPKPAPGGKPAAIPETLAPEALEALLAGGAQLNPSSDTTNGLSQTGEVEFQNVPPSPWLSSAGEQRIWLLCSLLTPIVADPQQADGSQSDSDPRPAALTPKDLPVIEAVGVTVEIDRHDQSVQLAFFNNTPLDLTKDFYPFGERPKFGDTLYLGSSELFSSQEIAAVLHIEMTNPAGLAGSSPVPPAGPQKVKLAWEFWDGTSWSQIGATGEAAPFRIVGPTGSPTQSESFHDTTKALSVDGDVIFQLPRPPVQTIVQGQRNYWIRVRIVAGNYGQEAHVHKEVIGSEIVPSSLAPPMIRSIRAEYQVRQQVQPKALTAYNDFTYQQVDPTMSFRPWQPVADTTPALYFGFEPPPAKAQTAAALTSLGPQFPPYSLSIYLDVEQSVHGISAQDAESPSSALKWEYWQGTSWSPLPVREETNGFRHPGLIRLVTPTDFAASSRFGWTRHWMRVNAPNANQPISNQPSPSPTSPSPTSPASTSPASTSPAQPSANQPLLRSVLPNSVMATAGTTLLNESLGVSNGMPGQSFLLLHPPILAGQQIEVLEPRIPGCQEQNAIRQAEGDQAIMSQSSTPMRTGQAGSNAQTGQTSQTGQPSPLGQASYWIRWHEVPDFSSSGPRDRHYVLDPASGLVLFGDAIHGQIPPRGGKVRASRYRTGGGAAGNRPSGNITQLKTAIPYVGKVWNWLPASAGGDAEDDQALLRRGSRGLRHRGRAVTIQDYEDLAYLATPQVALAKCVPLFDLATDPDARRRRPGLVSLIVVPRANPSTDDPRPEPSSQLMENVLHYVQGSSPTSARISVTGPDYVRIDVTTAIVINDPGVAARIETAVNTRLNNFLHPLKGGLNGAGWEFGRLPQKSDLYELLEAIPGVSYVRDIAIIALADRAGIEDGDRFLVCAGTMQVELTFQSESRASN